MEETHRVAAVAGATGLVGRHLVQALLASPVFSKVISFSRSAPGLSHPKLHAVELPDFQRISEAADQFELSITDGFSALGTTQAKAGNEEAFRLVDHDFIVDFAKACEADGAERFFAVSSVGAAARSSNFYLRVKGETERDLEALRFGALHIFRPSLLLGPRSERRFAEGMGQTLAPLISPLLLGQARRYKPIAGVDVAQAMTAAASEDHPAKPVTVYHYDEMQRLIRR